MMPRYADMRGALERFPNVTNEERIALWQWYGNAHIVDADAEPHEPGDRLPRYDYHRELRSRLWMRLCFPGVTIAVVALTVATLT